MNETKTILENNLKFVFILLFITLQDNIPARGIYTLHIKNAFKIG